MAQREHREPGSCARALPASVPKSLIPSASGSWDPAPVGLSGSCLSNTRPETARPQLWPLKAPSRLPLPPSSWPTEATRDPVAASLPTRTHRLGSSGVRAGAGLNGVAASGVRGPGTLSPPRAR